MIRSYLLATSLVSALTLSASLAAQTSGPGEQNVNWETGPVKVRLGDQGELNVPAGYVFADPENTAKFLQNTHNVPTGKELGMIASIRDKWFSIYEFDPVGFVRDDEKDKLDADALLDHIRRGSEEENVERRKRGWEAFTITGWINPPLYDQNTHRLSWSIVGRGDDGVESANYFTRVLGRRGVMNLELVASPGDLNVVLPKFETAAIGGFDFTVQNRYAAFKKGDKVAEYGLTALILGGAAAVAAKTGLLKYIVKLLVVGWKLVVVAVGAFLAFLKRLFTRRKKAVPAAFAAE
jgi:uncharacterized membrane-anchored protein